MPPIERTSWPPGTPCFVFDSSDLEKVRPHAELKTLSLWFLSISLVLCLSKMEQVYIPPPHDSSLHTIAPMFS